MYEFPPSLWDRVAGGSVDLATLLPLAVEQRGVTLYRCGLCSPAVQPRPAFALFDTRDLADFKSDWTCDNHLVDARRAIDAAAAASNPPAPPAPTMTPGAFMALWTPAQTSAAYKSEDDAVVYFRTRLLTAEYVLLADPATQAGIEQCRFMGILTDDEAARIAAGLPIA